ncbi:keto-hydroxyglutarate-aldolase/keto-deoxy-phosphogluconate aldolase, partial [Xylella fastidiosa subsp. multiplex]|nr:keto-hydroxyglutarate-aldolase/keto-deoxy-phosphogluconate aldolase [Xylella fastidiosa subsp. multiplex]
WMVPKDWLAQGHWDNIKNTASKAAAIIQQARNH